MGLEENIKGIIAEYLEKGMIENSVNEYFQKSIEHALTKSFGEYGDITKIIECEIKKVIVPHLEKFDYSKYITKLDYVLTEVLKTATAENEALLKNFKEFMLPEARKEIKLTELFEIWKKYVSVVIDESKLKIDYDDGVSYSDANVFFNVYYDDKNRWSSFEYATITFECKEDEEMNFEMKASHYENDVLGVYNIGYHPNVELRSLKYLSHFEILLMRLYQANTKLLIDKDFEEDQVTVEAEPQPTFE